MPNQSGAETLAMRNKIYMTVQEAVIGAGTGNYNKLQNKPVINLVGSTEEKHVDLSGLEQGKYTLRGYYKLTPDAEMQVQNLPVDVSVLNELVYSETDPGADPVLKKIIYYIYAKEDEVFMKKIVYDEDNQYESDDDVCLTDRRGDGGESIWEEDQ